MINVTNVRPEPYWGSSVLMKILTSNRFKQVKEGLIFGASALLGVILISFVMMMCNLVIYRPTVLKAGDWIYQDSIPKLRLKINQYQLVH